MGWCNRAGAKAEADKVAAEKNAADEAAIKAVDDHAAALDDLAKTLLAQEHASLRDEILASYGYAQSIVKWTIATFAAIAAAGLIAMNNATASALNLPLIYVVFLIFGVGLPAIVWLYSYTWVGELMRAERAGSYLRGLEASVSGISGLNDRLGVQPLRWESFIWSNREVKRSSWGKQTITYVGTAGVFLGAPLGSFAILWILVGSLVGTGPVDGLAYFWVAGSGLLNAGFFVVFIRMCRLVFALGRKAAPLESVYGDIFSSTAAQKQ